MKAYIYIAILCLVTTNLFALDLIRIPEEGIDEATCRSEMWYHSFKGKYIATNDDLTIIVEFLHPKNPTRTAYINNFTRTVRLAGLDFCFPNIKKKQDIKNMIDEWLKGKEIEILMKHEEFLIWYDNPPCLIAADNGSVNYTLLAYGYAQYSTYVKFELHGWHDTAFQQAREEMEENTANQSVDTTDVTAPQ